MVYVDDVIIFAPSNSTIDKTLRSLVRELEIHIMNTGKFLGYQYLVQPNGDIFLHQPQYISDVLAKYGLINSMPVETPLVGSKKGQDLSPSKDNTRYREVISSLQYETSQTRLDIAYAIGAQSQFAYKSGLARFKKSSEILKRHHESWLDI